MPGGAVESCAGGVVRGLGRCGAVVRRQGCVLNGAGALRRGVGALGPGGEVRQCPARGGFRCRRDCPRRRDGGTVVRRQGCALNEAGELRRGVGALGTGGEAR